MPPTRGRRRQSRLCTTGRRSWRRLRSSSRPGGARCVERWRCESGAAWRRRNPAMCLSPRHVPAPALCTCLVMPSCLPQESELATAERTQQELFQRMFAAPGSCALGLSPACLPACTGGPRWPTMLHAWPRSAHRLSGRPRRVPTSPCSVSPRSLERLARSKRTGRRGARAGGAGGRGGVRRRDLWQWPQAAGGRGGKD